MLWTQERRQEIIRRRINILRIDLENPTNGVLVIANLLSASSIIDFVDILVLCR